MDIYKIFVAILLLGVVNTSATAQRSLTSTTAIDYQAFGMPLPKDSAMQFVPGLISTTTTDERVVAIAPDGSELFFMRNGNQGPHIYQSTYKEGKWNFPTLADFTANEIATEPFISPDGKMLFFVSIRREFPTPDIWISSRSKNGWTAPTRLSDAINTAGEEWHPSVSADGHLYFASIRSGGYGNADLYFSKFENGAYAMSQNVGGMINTSYNEWDPYVAPDGNYMIFKSDRPGGFGGMDMYITWKKNGEWTKPQNLGAKVNTQLDDDAGDVTPDGKYLIFARGPQGARDIYWISMAAFREFTVDHSQQSK